MLPPNHRERIFAAAASIAAAWVFFLEYLPPLRRGHLIWDADSYHYPLLNQIVQTLQRGEFPEWDPAIYCGSSMAGNIQAQLFYPPAWILFAAHAFGEGMSLMSVHVFVALHFALSLLLAWAWLRGRGIGHLGSAAGALTFAFSGFRMNEIQHVGGTAAVTWFPLAFLGLDQAARQRRWQPMWKVAAASALCFLAGMPFVWSALCFCAAFYALTLEGRKRLFPWTVAAIAFSLVLSAVQILPAAEAAGMQVRRNTFGGAGIPRAVDYYSMLAPNFFDQSRAAPPADAQYYLYLGAPALFAIGWLLWRRKLLGAGPALALIAGAHLIMANPFDWVATLFRYLSPLDRMVREWNLLACLPAGAALLAAVAADDFTRRPLAGRLRRILPWIATAAALAWSARQLAVWSTPRQAFGSGWASAAEAAITLACLLVCLCAVRASRREGWRTAAMLAAGLMVFVDFKVYGTSRRFDYEAGNPDELYASDARLGGPEFRGMETGAYARMLATPGYRVLHLSDPTARDLRFYRLDTPQGNDPILPARYLDVLGSGVEWKSDRTFVVEPANREWLDRFGVGWVLARRGTPEYEGASKMPHLRAADSVDSFTAVFRYTDAKPRWRWTGRAVKVTSWQGSRRSFEVESEGGGVFRLIEQAYPGWSAKVDGRAVQLSRTGEGFLEVQIPGGRHKIEFSYRAHGLRAGALASALGWMVLLVLVKRG